MIYSVTRVVPFVGKVTEEMTEQEIEIMTLIYGYEVISKTPIGEKRKDLYIYCRNKDV